jgi:hypothetical protein
MRRGALQGHLAHKKQAYACQSMGRGAMALPGWSNVCWCGSNRSARSAFEFTGVQGFLEIKDTPSR